MIWTRPDNPRAEVLFKGRFPKRQQITVVSNYGLEGNRMFKMSKRGSEI